MKIRLGFVSNSSSSSFILDKSLQESKEMIDKLWEGVYDNYENYSDLCRHTIYMNAEEALSFAKTLREDGFSPIHAEQIEKYYKLLGDNLVYIRESDEGIGGYFFRHLNLGWEEECKLLKKLEEIALWQGEYH